MRTVDTRWMRAALLACVAIACGAAGAAGAADARRGGARAERADGAQGRGSLHRGAGGNGGVRARARPDPRSEGSDEQANRIINLKDVAATDGVARIDLGEPGRGATVSAEAHVRGQNPERTAIHRGETIVKLRPDLVVAAVHAPPQTLSTRPIDVVADISELNLETGRQGDREADARPDPGRRATDRDGAGRRQLSVPFKDVKLTTADVGRAHRRDRRRRARSRPTRRTTPARRRSRSPSTSSSARTCSSRALGGYGAQFNNHVYAPITPGRRAASPTSRRRSKALEPQLVRIFYNDIWEERDAGLGRTSPRSTRPSSSRRRRGRRSTSPTTPRRSRDSIRSRP